MSPTPFLLDKQIGMWIHALPFLFGTHHEKTQDKKTTTIHLPILLGCPSIFNLESVPTIL
jgi:hypothetical protein